MRDIDYKILNRIKLKKKLKIQAIHFDSLYSDLKIKPYLIIFTYKQTRII